VPAPLPFAIPVGSIVWSPHQMLRRGTASTDRSCEASWGTARTRPSFGGARQAPEGPLREGTGAANIAFPEAPATLRDSTWKRSAGSQCAPPRTGGVSLAGKPTCTHHPSTLLDGRGPGTRKDSSA